MEKILMYPAGSTKACQYASKALALAGVPVTDHPTPEVTHLLLDVPSFSPEGCLRGGGELEPLLRMLPPGIAVAGGNLNHPGLSGYLTLDLLADPTYLAKNAAITADCALRVAGAELDTAFTDAPALVIGWGRIGKCLARLLRSLGSEVTVAARKESDRAMLAALGYSSMDIGEIPALLPRYRLLFNTAPEKVLSGKQLAGCRHCVKIDLASKPGLEGSDVIAARGLPGRYTPESSGKLIAETVLRLIGEGMS